MTLSQRTLERLGKMVVGDAKFFPYRSSSRIDRFFRRCGLPFIHDGTTRASWAEARLAELNLGVSQSPDLPPDELCRVITELFDQDDFDDHNDKKADASGAVSLEECASVERALKDFNRVVAREGLVAYLDKSGRCHLRSDGTGTASFNQSTRPPSPEELRQRALLASFLATASEDEFTEKVLVPFFQRLGFRRVSPTGHKDKSLEFGKDLWMKYQLPTSHWLSSLLTFGPL
jgi:hypothetical protein